MGPVAGLGGKPHLARQQSEYASQADLARAVGVERTAITRAEAGSVTAQVLAEILTQCGVTGLAQEAIKGMHRLARRADDPSSAAVEPWYEVEARAHTLRFWQPIVIPGLLQTERYGYSLPIRRPTACPRRWEPRPAWAGQCRWHQPPASPT